MNNAYFIAAGSKQIKHIFAGSQRITSKMVNGMVGAYEGEQYYFYGDHLGSSSFITDTAGDVYEHLEYFPYGETWGHQQSGSTSTPYKFTGKELDEETGLYYYGARYYDPRTSVFVSTDPILAEYMSGKVNGGVFNPANLKLFSYTMNNPVNMVDPDGTSLVTIDPLSGGRVDVYHNNDSHDDFYVRDGPRKYFTKVGQLDKNIFGLVSLKSSSTTLESGGKAGFNVKSGKDYDKFATTRAAAGLYGVSYNTQAKDFTVIGSTSYEGRSMKPSTSHTGNNVDIRFSRKDQSGASLNITTNPSMLDSNRQLEVNKALNIYGWGNLKGGVAGGIDVPLANPMKGHNNHIHAQGFFNQKGKDYY